MLQRRHVICLVCLLSIIISLWCYSYVTYFAVDISIFKKQEHVQKQNNTNISYQGITDNKKYDVPSNWTKTAVTKVNITNLADSNNTGVLNETFLTKTPDEKSLVKTLYIITPTYFRPSQHPDLTRMAQTLGSVSGRIHWLVVEDALSSSTWVRQLLNHTVPTSHTLLHCTRETGTTSKAERLLVTKRLCLPASQPLANGVSQRNCALTWLLKHNISDGVMFFGDDDNAYDVRLFAEINDTSRVSVFPVGNFAGVGVSSAVVKNGKVVNFIDNWVAKRKWPVDMACFAVDIVFWRSRGSPLMVDVKGYIEDAFFRDLNVTHRDMEPKADNCTKIYVWHTQTVTMKTNKSTFDKLRQTYPGTNVQQLGSEVDTRWTKL